MEMFEDESNNLLKRSKIQQTLENEQEEEDRISALDDGLIVEILSHLPSTKDAIRTGTLSKRWKSIWTSVPTLLFIQARNKYFLHAYESSEFISSVNNTLAQCHHSKLKEFQLSVIYKRQFESDINDWIRYATSLNVEVLNFLLEFCSKAHVLSHEHFFINSCFTRLRLGGFKFSPNGPISWKMLKDLRIGKAKLNEDLIENILSGSPILETLVLKDCRGFTRLDITSKCVKNLVLDGYFRFKDDEEYGVVEIKAPNILLLSVLSGLDLRKLLLLDVSSLVEAELDCLSCFRARGEEVEEELLKGLIQSLHHVKELRIWAFSPGINRLKANGFPFPSNVKFTIARSQWTF